MDATATTDPRRHTLTSWELRALLTLHIHAAGQATVADLVEVVRREGVELAGRESKVVSDALRAEVAKGWVRRVRRGTYVPGRLPKSSKHRLRGRVDAARSRRA